ncbi:hypothetical protein [Hansschlegelia sp. KR7-227]|uniref:hypothetical protein n=1 Tax=Hansschlegelia sp. KR7-227 TaxID=3400914 RepID=UPI003C05AA1F
MKTIIYAIGALVLASSAASAEAMRSHPGSNQAQSASHGSAANPGQDRSSVAAGKHASQQRFAPQSPDVAGRWDANDNNG